MRRPAVAGAASVSLLSLVLGGCAAAPRPVAAPRQLHVPASQAPPARHHVVHPRPASMVPALRPPSDARTLRLVRSITGAISPKSVVAGPRGLVFAQNMMYLHTVTVYDAHGVLRRTIPDTVRLSSYGIAGHPGISNGAPVEAAFDPSGRYAYVSNYSMYGTGFGPEGSDVCSPRSVAADGVSPSYVYRVNLRSLRVDRVFQVGVVPKFVTVTPNGRYVLVSNWCSYTVSVVRASTGKSVREIYVGAYPRGIAVTPDSRTAYVAVMGSTHIAVLNLHRLRVSGQIAVGNSPRHVVLGPAGRYLYVSLNAEGSVVKINRHTGRVIGRAYTGRDPRSLTVAPDGRTLYVVNYLSDTVSAVRARDMRVLQTIPTGDYPIPGHPSHPIGITYNTVGNRVWVALYSGKILVFAVR